MSNKTITLTLRHLKSRAVSDYTFSEHAEGWDDAMHAVADQLAKVGIAVEWRDATAKELEEQ